MGMRDRSDGRGKSIIPIERIASRIYLIRGRKVMLDYDLAELYGVTTKRLNEQVTRNPDRFPEDFMIRLSSDETRLLNRSQIATGYQKHRDPRYPPRAFTEHGVAMLSSVLRSKKAVQVNLAIIRTFIRLRQVLASKEDLAFKVNELDRKVAVLFDQVRELLEPPDPPKKHPIGF